MDVKKIALALIILVTVFAGIGIAGVVIGGGQQPTSNSIVELTAAEQTAIKEWYGIADFSDFNVGETICDANACSVRVYKDGFIDDKVTMHLMTCGDAECQTMREKTVQEFETERDAKIQARLEGIADAAKQRNERTLIAKVGEGTITVNTK